MVGQEIRPSFHWQTRVGVDEIIVPYFWLAESMLMKIATSIIDE